MCDSLFVMFSLVCAVLAVVFVVIGVGGEQVTVTGAYDY